MVGRESENPVPFLLLNSNPAVKLRNPEKSSHKKIGGENLFPPPPVFGFNRILLSAYYI